ncbi:DNA cytosine methyltransferase [Mycolicibacterium sp.]|uniref:DNA cytosine methyltransferase n=1 Tax=Mycolicibacterium sp. TaxID=2320850 RepID=UPI0028A9B215|nr:DNA cytosine methyltransferase [Mycolicibacterium sp.]
MRIGSLFSGAGGLDMAVEQVFGGEVIWQCEMDKAASKVLAYRYPCAPNLGDITAVDWSTVETPDVLCGGFPCQDVSAAGKRAGIKDGTRSGLWSVFADIIDTLRPPIVIIENVRGLLSAKAHRNLESDDATLGDGTDGPVLRAAGAVLGDLADLGYDAQWATVAAASVGAPHRRERVFILASRGVVSHPGHDGGCPEQGVEHQKKTGGLGQSGNRTGNVVGGSDAALGGDADGGVELLPTPCVVDRLATGEMTLDEWDESRRAQKEKGVGSFGPRGDSLGAAVLRVEEGVVDQRPDYSTKAQDREPLLPTPCAQQSGNTPEEHLRKKPGRKVVTDLAILVENGLLTTGGALLPTPVVTDSSDSARHTIVGGTSHPGTSLTDAIRLLPTPQAHDSQGPKTPEQIATMRAKGAGVRNLNETAVHELLSTPQSRDYKGQPADGFNNANLCRDVANLTAWGKYEPAIRRWERLTRPAPAPTEPNKNGNPRLSAAFSEWLMGWPAGWVTDPAIGISRNDQLRIVGNGVCSQQAAAALRQLLAVTA